MNVQATFKTALVVLAIGALTGFQEWRSVHAGTPQEQEAKAIAQCVKQRQEESYRNTSLMMGRVYKESQRRIQTECRDRVGAERSVPDFSKGHSISFKPTP